MLFLCSICLFCDCVQLRCVFFSLILKESNDSNSGDSEEDTGSEEDATDEDGGEEDEEEGEDEDLEGKYYKCLPRVGFRCF